MSFLKKLFGGSNGSTKDYDYYLIQKRQGGIYGKWESIEELNDFLDSATGVATYGDGTDATLQCLGVKKFGDREVKKRLWQHISREDIEEEIEDRKKRVGKKETKEDDLEKYLRILNSAKEEERVKLENMMGMMSTFYQNQYDLIAGLNNQGLEANKYTVWQQGIHEVSEVGKEIVRELRGSGRNDDESEDG